LNKFILILFIVFIFIINYIGGNDYLFHEVFRSPPTSCHQGYTTDGIYHFTIYTNIIYKRLDDIFWTTIKYNNKPFYGLIGTYQHLGDGDYYNYKLYLPAQEAWQGCIQYHPAILIYNADNLLCENEYSLDVINEASGLVVVPEHGIHGIIYLVSHCDPLNIYKYDLLYPSTFLGYMQLSMPISKIQGITYKNAYFYLSGDGNCLYRGYELNGSLQSIELIYKSPYHDNCAEGLDYSQNQIRWLCDLDMGTTSTIMRYVFYLVDYTGVENWINY